MWIYPDEMSKWALDQIKKGMMNKSAKEMITDSKYAYVYCRDIEDDPVVRKMINEPQWAYKYCKDIRDDYKMALKIWDPNYLEKYLLEIKKLPKWKSNCFVTFYCLIIISILIPFILIGSLFELVGKVAWRIKKWVR